jgi:hypothetical protein
MIADNPIPVTAAPLVPDPDLQAWRRQQIERFSVMVAEGLRVESLTGLPACCSPVLSDDLSKVAGINFWAIEPLGDSELDYVTGECFADDAVQYVRDRGHPEVLTCILMWVGATLHFEERCAGPLERGFIERVLKDYPDAVDRLFMAVYQQHPERLN